MARYPAAAWTPGACPQGSFASGRPIGAVLHRTYGSFGGDNSVALGANPPVGFHFLIPKSAGNGIRQYYDTSTRTAHAGENRYGNDLYLGVEFEGVNGDTLTGYQLEAGSGLLAWITATHGIPLVYRFSENHDVYDHHGYLPHSAIPDSTHSDWISEADFGRLAGPVQGSHPLSREVEEMLVQVRGAGTVYLVSGGRITAVRNGDSLPGLTTVLGPVAVIDPGTFDAMKTAYGGLY